MKKKLKNITCILIIVILAGITLFNIYHKLELMRMENNISNTSDSKIDSNEESEEEKEVGEQSEEKELEKQKLKAQMNKLAQEIENIQENEKKKTIPWEN